MKRLSLLKFVLVVLVFKIPDFSYSQHLPRGFVYVEEVIPTIEIDLKYFGHDNFTGKPVKGYLNSRCILSNEAMLQLKKVQEELSAYGLGLKIFDAYRPQQAVDFFAAWAENLKDTIQKKKYYPNVKKENLFKEGYIAMRSGHSRGSTVDLTLVYLSTGEELDMGSRYDYFGKKSWPTHEGVTRDQKVNRLLLQVVMTKHGFQPYLKEWWHFTLKKEPYPTTYFNFLIQ